MSVWNLVLRRVSITAYAQHTTVDFFLLCLFLLLTSSPRSHGLAVRGVVEEQKDLGSVPTLSNCFSMAIRW